MTDTAFEQLLEQKFPDIYKLNNLGKVDPKFWRALYVMLDYANRKTYGKIEIHYQEGKIDHVNKSERVFT